MTGSGQNFEWYIGRDGQQFGPVTNRELDKLIELAQLRPNDLVWRAGLADWQPAASLFDMNPAQPAPAASTEAVNASMATGQASRAAEAQPQRSPAGAGSAHDPRYTDVSSPGGATAAVATRPVAETIPHVTNPDPPGPVSGSSPVSKAAAVNQPRTQSPAQRISERATSTQVGVETAGAASMADLRLEDVAAAIKAVSGPVAKAAGEAPRSAQPNSAQSYRTNPSPAQSYETELRDGARENAGDGAPAAKAPRVDASEYRQTRQPQTRASNVPDEIAERRRPQQKKKGKPRRGTGSVIAFVTLLSLMLAGAAAAYFWRGPLSEFVASHIPGKGEPTAQPTANAPAQPIRPAAEKSPSPVTTATGNTPPPETLPAWQLVRQEFPEWYDERVKEAERLRRERTPDGNVTKYLAEQLVALRRNHADDALGASSVRLREIAATFVENLRELNRHSVDACYSFVSHGEASPAILPLLAEKDVSTAMDKQLVAIFEAVAEGRKQRVTHLPPRKADYDALAAELLKRGWTDLDLQVFSDPRALGRASPVVVCRLVREWFSAHLALQDSNIQVRLLVESLRPVVGG